MRKSFFVFFCWSFFFYIYIYIYFCWTFFSAESINLFHLFKIIFQLPTKKILMMLEQKVAQEIRASENGKERLMDIISKVCRNDSKKVSIAVYTINIYSKTSMTQTPMAYLPWLI